MDSPRIALIHALAHSIAPINQGFERLWPAAQRMNLLDDSLSQDLAAQELIKPGSGLDERMHERFAELTRYAFSTGCDAVLYTCSAFGSCIDAAAQAWPGKPVLRPNAGMIEQASSAMAQLQKLSTAPLTLGLLSSFAPTLQSLPQEFPQPEQLVKALAEGAMQALNDGNRGRHDELILQAAHSLKAQGVSAICLAQYSNAHMRDAVAAQTGLPVFNTVDSSIELLRTRLNSRLA